MSTKPKPKRVRNDWLKAAIKAENEVLERDRRLDNQTRLLGLREAKIKLLQQTIHALTSQDTVEVRSFALGDSKIVTVWPTWYHLDATQRMSLLQSLQQWVNEQISTAFGDKNKR